jgi:hypothetical protein
MLEIDWLSIALNLSTSTGHDSLNRLIWDIMMSTKPNSRRKVMSNVNVIATTLLILKRVIRFTTGCKTIARIIAKTIGTIMLLPIYIIARVAINPNSIMVNFP